MELNEKVRIVDGPEDEETSMRNKEERKSKKLSIKSREKYRLLAPALKKEKKKVGMDEEVIELNNSYQEMFELALEQYGVKNIRDLPEDKKAEFFAVVDEALKGNQHKIDANKNGKVDAHDFKLLRSKKKQPQVAESGRMDERYEDDDYGSMSKKEFKRREMEHELGHENETKRKYPYSKMTGTRYTRPTSRPYSGFKKEETELTFEEMTPAQKADRLKMIARAADRVQSGAAAKAVKKIAKADMNKKGAQKGMAPTKKDEVEEQVQELRKMIKENNNRAEAYKLLAKILNNA